MDIKITVERNDICEAPSGLQVTEGVSSFNIVLCQMGEPVLVQQIDPGISCPEALQFCPLLSVADNSDQRRSRRKITDQCTGALREVGPAYFPTTRRGIKHVLFHLTSNFRAPDLAPLPPSVS